MRYCSPITAALACCALSAAACADFDATKWRWKATVVIDQPVAGEFARVRISPEALTKAKPGLDDLRIVDDQGIETPYALAPTADRVHETEHAPAVYNQTAQTTTHTECVLDIGRTGIQSNQVTLQLDGANFVRRVTVKASDNTTHWLILRQGAHIFDFTQVHGAKHTTVTYPDAIFRFLKITVWNDDHPPLTVRSATIKLRQENRPLGEPRDVALLETKQVPNATRMILDLGHESIPSCELTLDATAANFQRRVDVEGRNALDDKLDPWRPLGSDIIFSFRTQSFEHKRVRVRYPEALCRYLRITIHNRDGKPLPIAGVSVSGAVRQALIAFKPGRRYFAWVGSPEAQRPDYDLGDALPRALGEDCPQFALGKIEPNATYGAGQGQPSHERPWLMWAVVAAVVIGLGALTLSMLQKLTGVTADDLPD